METLEIVKLVMGIAIIKNWFLYHLDVKYAS